MIASLIQGCFQLTFLVHLLANVDAPNQLAAHVELRIRWPLTVDLQRLSHLLVTEDVKVCVLAPPHVLLDQLDDLAAEAALGRCRLTLHK